VCAGNLVREGTLQFILHSFGNVGNKGSDFDCNLGNLFSSHIAFSSERRRSPLIVALKSRSPLKSDRRLGSDRENVNAQCVERPIATSKLEEPELVYALA